jgi:hypothetical protein
LLAEETRENLALYSADFGDATWAKVLNVAVDTNVATAPDGTLTADRVRKTSTGLGAVYQAITFSGTTTVSESVFAKKDSSNYAAFTAGGICDLTVDLTNGAVTRNTGAFTNVSVAPFKDGFYRIAYTVSRPTGSQATLYMWPTDLANNSSFGTVSPTTSYFLWGAQVEVGSFATSIIPTTSSKLTRNADELRITGADFTSWYNASEGTLVAEGTALSGDNRFFALGSNTADNYHLVSASSATTVASGTPQAAFANAVTANAIYRSAYSYKLDSFANAINGGAASTDTSGSLPTGIDRAEFGSIFTSSLLAGSGHLRKMLYYTQQLTTAELRAFSKQA